MDKAPDSSSRGWHSALTLNSDRKVQRGSADELNAAISRGADLRILTEFRFNEHIDPESTDTELIREVCDFQTVYRLDGRWVAGIMTLRQPVSLPDQFGPRPSMSFFVYNQDGEQGIARPYLDGAKLPLIDPRPFSDYPRYRQHDDWDAETNAPCHNFIYDFDVFDFFVRDDWHEVLSHDEHGAVLPGSVENLARCFSQGAQIKVAIRNLARNLPTGGDASLDHEVFVQAGSCYYYTASRVFIAGTNPLVRVQPAIPLKYGPGNWDCGWCVARTDGRVVYRSLDPRSLTFSDQEQRLPLRWFAR